MYRNAPDLPPTPEAHGAQATFDCRATAALLRSMRALEWASHLGALLAFSYHTWLPLLAWGTVLYFAVRVRFDAELLEVLADDPKCAPASLDHWLSRTGQRSIADRCKGARRLALYLLCALLLQIAATAMLVWRANR